MQAIKVLIIAEKTPKTNVNGNVPSYKHETPINYFFV